MARETKVVDASVVVKWFTNEAGSDSAIWLRDEHITGKVRMVVPELLFLEVLNTLRYKHQDEVFLRRVSRELVDVQFHVEKLTPFLLEKALSVALEYKLSVYDALYGATSMVHGAPLITADEKLKKVPNAVPLR